MLAVVRCRKIRNVMSNGRNVPFLKMWVNCVVLPLCGDAGVGHRQLYGSPRPRVLQRKLILHASHSDSEIQHPIVAG